MKHHLLFFLMSLSVAVAVAAADPHPPQQMQVEQQQHSQMRSMGIRATRSLLQSPKPDCPPACSLLQQPKPDCPSSCSVRCSNNWKKEMCNKVCNACCNKCSCVPPGTGQDTRHLCPCYDTMINPHNGKLKCP